MGAGACRVENLILINGAVLMGIAIPHLIDDFLYSIPEEFGLSNLNVQILVGIISIILVWIFFRVGRRNRTGMFSSAIMGIFLALAGMLKHVPHMVEPGP